MPRSAAARDIAARGGVLLAARSGSGLGPCHTPGLTATTERSRSGSATKRARDGASRAGATDAKVAREPCGRRPLDGWTTTPRWLRVSGSAVGIRNVGEGFEIEAPVDKDLESQFQSVSGAHGVVPLDDGRLMLRVPWRTLHH
jgi:hypothetical protein